MGRKSRYQLAVIQDQTMTLNGGISKWDFCSVHFWWSDFLSRRSAPPQEATPNHQTWNKQIILITMMAASHTKHATNNNGKLPTQR